MKKTVFSFFFSGILIPAACLFQSSPALSQNLLSNGGFETYTSLPTGYGQTNRALGWTNVNLNYSGPPFASPDYFHTLGSVGNYFGQIAPNTGNAQMGFCTWHTPSLVNFREYISKQLDCPMIPGQQYQVSFYLSNGLNGGYSKGTNGVGVHFSVGPLFQAIDQPIPVTPQFEIATITYISNAWQLYTFTYTATNAANYFTMGNFRNDANTLVSAFGNTGAYYFVDDIVIAPVLSAVPMLGNDTTLCTGQQLLLNVTTPGATYLWQDNSTNPTYTVTQPGSYWVQITYNCASMADTIVVSYDTIPFANLGSDTTLCTGQPLVLNAAITGATYLWQDNSTNSSFTVTQQGTYWVQVTNNCGVAADTVTVTYDPLPVVNLGNDTNLCTGQQLSLNAVYPGATYLWQDNSTNSSFTVTQQGTYWVQVSNNCAAVSDTVTITYTPLPAVNLGNDTTLCTGQPITLNATMPGVTYLWQDNSTNSTFTVTQQGSYWVQVTNNCGVDADTITVNYDPLPLVNLGNDTTLCAGQLLTLNAASPGVTYLWQDNSTNATFTVAQQGSYWVQLTNNCGIAADTLTVNYDPLPAVNIGNDTTLCIGQSIVLNAASAGVTYLWQDNSTNPTFTATQQGSYSVQVMNNCGVASDNVTITFNSPPTIDLGDDTVLCLGQVLVLNASTPGAAYLWQDNTTNPVYVVTHEGIYHVEVSNACGTNDDFIAVESEDCYCFIYVPNVFTPNKDNTNETFLPVSNCSFSSYQLTIYNRWGEKIYATNDPTAWWDGTYQGHLSPIDVYEYILIYQFADGKKGTKYGGVSLIR